MKLITFSKNCFVFATIVCLLPLKAAVSAPLTMTEEVNPSPQQSVVLPKILSQVAAIYPAKINRSGGEAVIVVFTVDEEGVVKDPTVISTPATQLEDPAKKAVLAWKFSPGSREGRPASFHLKAPVSFSVTGDNMDDAPAAANKLAAVYPYEQLIQGQTGWGEASFVVDYSGRAILTAPAAGSHSAFSKSIVAMIEATQFSPARKNKRPVMASSCDRAFFSPESALDPVARTVLSELRKSSPAIFAASDLDERPRGVAQRSAVYPRSMKTDGTTGQAEIEFIIDRDGRVLFPRIVSASHEDFGWAAATAVAQWKFNPPLRNGQRVEARMSIPVMFDAEKLASSD